MDSATSAASVNSLWSLFQKTEGKNKYFDLLFILLNVLLESFTLETNISDI
jgi:hypothetical protein